MSFKIKVNTVKKSVEHSLAAMIGAKFYQSDTDFTQEQLYVYGGRKDCIFTLTFKIGSISYQKYGGPITVRLIYSLKDRKALEENLDALNEKQNIFVELLQPVLENEIIAELQKEGIPIQDIDSMIVIPSTEENNTYFSKEYRSLNLVNIFCPAMDDDQNINWVYTFLKRQKQKGVGLMPEDDAMFLAYKLILEKGLLTDEEKECIFDNYGRVSNRSVAYYLLSYKNDIKDLSCDQKKLLIAIKRMRFEERLTEVEKTLKTMGLSMEKLYRNNPNQVMFLMDKIINFRDRNFNTTGKYPLYMNFSSFLHIYFRHTNELSISSQFAGKDKFQLKEEDIIKVMDIVIGALNNDYQKEKEKNPKGKFWRSGSKAYYYNGDYYHVDVNPNGIINTFYRGTGKK